MWAKSFAGILSGLVISISVLVTLYYVLPLAPDVRIMLGLLFGWVVWAAVMVWCYASESGRQAWKRAGGFALVTVALNTALFFTQGGKWGHNLTT